MKLFITQDQMNSLTPQEAEFIRIWRTHKNYSHTASLSLGECLELLIAFSYNLHFDYSDGRFFNNILINNESVIGWDGLAPLNELIDILFFEAREAIKRRLIQSGTFNAEEVKT